MGAFASVWVLYFSGKAFSAAKKWPLAILRFFTLFIIGFLLLAPLFKVSQLVNEKPKLVWLEDHSSSVVSGKDSMEIRDLLGKDKNELIVKLSEKFDVQQLSFGAKINGPKEGLLNQRETNISAAINEVNQRFYNENVGAIVMLTDGIYNRGVNPIYQAQRSGFPLYTVGLGDTTVNRDLFIEKLVHNELSYLDNNFPLEVSIRARKLSNKEVKVVVKNKNGTAVDHQNLKIKGSNFFSKLSFYIKAKEVGLQRYTVSLSVLEGEKSVTNNSESFSIEVIDNRKKILILGSAPHPDMGAIASALSYLDKYEVSTAISTDYDFDVKEPDLYIIHQADEAIYKRLYNSTKPFWMIYGEKVNALRFAQFTGIQFTRGNSLEDVQVHADPDFSLFTFNQDWLEFCKRLPPLKSPFGRMNVEGSFKPLLYKKIGQLETNNMLWFFGDQDNRRISYLMGSGIWQWRMYTYRQNQSFELFDQIIAQSAQYLTAKIEDQRFVVEAESGYDSELPVIMSARLYNPAMEAVNNPEVEIVIQSEDGKDYNFSFSKEGNNYKLDAGQLSPANYSWKAKTKLGNEEFVRQGSFSIKKIDIEQTDLLARHQLLKDMSTQSGGEFYHKNNTSEMVDKLLSGTSAKSIQRLETNISSLLNKKWIFFTLLLLLTIEWGLRKYFGKY